MFSIGFLTNLLNTILLYKEKMIALTPYIATFFIFFYVTYLNLERSHIVNFSFIFIIPVAIALFHNYKLILTSIVLSTLEIIYFFINRSELTFSSSIKDVHVFHYVVISILIGVFSFSSYKFSQKLISLAQSNQVKTEKVLHHIKETIDELNDFNKDLHVNVQEVSMLSESAEIVIRHTVDTSQTDNMKIKQIDDFIQHIKNQIIKLTEESDDQKSFEINRLFKNFEILSSEFEQIKNSHQNNTQAMKMLLESSELKSDKTRNIVSGFENLKDQLDKIHTQN